MSNQENWVTKALCQEARSSEQGRYPLLSGEIALWDSLMKQCYAAVQAVNHVHTLLGAHFQTQQDGLFWRATVTKASEPQPLLRLTFNASHPSFNATYPATEREESFMLVLDPENAIHLEHGGELITVEEACRRLLAPILLNIEVHIPPRQRL